MAFLVRARTQTVRSGPDQLRPQILCAFLGQAPHRRERRRGVARRIPAVGRSIEPAFYHVTLVNLRRAFKTFGAFTSGIGINYAESTIVNTKHQSVAKKLIVGQRMPPQVIVRVADARACELQDLLPSDTRFKILVFAGDTTNPTQRVRVEKLAVEMDEGFLSKSILGKTWDNAFDIITVSSGKKEDVDHHDVPQLFRSHWSK